MIDSRQRHVFRVLWTHGRLSRSELHARTGLRPNGVGALAESLLRDGLVRECPATAAGAGRPRVPLEVDPARRHLIGLALQPRQTEICRLSLAGEVLGPVDSRPCADIARLIPTAAALLAKHCDARTLGIGLSVTGLADPTQRTLLFSSATQGGPAADLSPIFDAAGDVPVVLDNDMHALAARWLLTDRADHEQDILMVTFGDGHLGAALLVEGRPNRGCATGGNELGHTRFPVETERCFCGHTGCMERIVSSGFLALRDRALIGHTVAAGREPSPTPPSSSSLDARAARFKATGADAPLDELMHHLACALANAVNFVRPHRLVLISPITRHAAFGDALIRQTRAMALPHLAERVRFDLWNEDVAVEAETAAWLAMAELLYGGWNQIRGNAQRVAE